MKRHLLNEIKRQHIIKARIAQAREQTGFTLPARVPVSLETLIEVRAALERHFASEVKDKSTLN